VFLEGRFCLHLKKTHTSIHPHQTNRETPSPIRQARCASEDAIRAQATATGALAAQRRLQAAVEKGGWGGSPIVAR